MLIGLLVGLVAGFILGLACAIAIVAVAGHSWRGIMHDWGIELVWRRHREEFKHELAEYERG
jgi:hypothetical protein